MNETTDKLDSKQARGSRRPLGWHEKLFGTAEAGNRRSASDALPAAPGPCAPSANPVPSPPLMAGKGTFFDEHMDLHDPEGTVFTTRVLEMFDAVRPKQRKINGTPRANQITRIRKLLASAVRAELTRTSPAVLYFRGADPKPYRGKATWMRHGALAEAVDALEDAGLVRTLTGKKMPRNSNTRSWASSYSATEALMQIASEHGISEKSLDWSMQADELVQLFGPKPRPVFDWHKGGLIHARKGEPIIFNPTPETEGWTSTLQAINAFYRQQEIAIGLSPTELALWVDERNADPERTGAPYRAPEVFQTDIYRVFNNGDQANPRFDEGGRLFGGWWMSVSDDLRSAITINGSPTVELDYAECHPRMLYHGRGLDGDGELYTLPEIVALATATGVPPNTYRPYVKWLMQVLINGRGRPQLAEKPEKVIAPTHYTIDDVIAFIETKHKPIADSFKTGAGMGLMRVESDIALEIISSAMVEGWTVLSVHDSFITTVDQRERLKAKMINMYITRLRKEPIIK